jgi:hypothetical protein
MEFSERAARNEEVFRSVNEQIEAGAEQHGVTAPMRFHCECDRERCFEQVDLIPSDYQQIVEHPYRFVIVPGHDDPRIEQIVETHEGYCVIEKIGTAREALDRRHPQERHRR